MGGHRPVIKLGYRADERGFTLIELLVVMLVIGVLAAVAIPAFFGQRAKGSDTSAVSNVRNLQTMVEACRVNAPDYSQCQTAAQLGANGLDFGSGAGQVQVIPNPLGAGGVAELAVASSGSTFIVYSLGGSDQHLCIPASGESLPHGACATGGPYSAYGYGTW